LGARNLSRILRELETFMNFRFRQRILAIAVCVFFSLPLLAQNAGGVADASKFGGADMGARIKSAAASCSNNCPVRIPPGKYDIGSNVTLPAVELRFDQGAVLKPAGGATVTFPRGPRAGRYQICDESAGGTCTFNGPTDAIYPEWFGAVADGSTDSSAAFQAAFNAAAAVCGVVSIAANTKHYVIRSQVRKPTCVSVRGNGSSRSQSLLGTFIDIDGANLVGFLDESNTGRNYYPFDGTWSDIAFRCLNGAATALKIEGRGHATIENVTINVGGGGACRQQALYFLNDANTRMVDSFVAGSGAADRCAVEIDRSDEAEFYDNWISNNKSALCGLRINRVGAVNITGGTIETSGTNILVQDIRQGEVSVARLLITGVDLENPSNGASSFINIGSGWTGTGRYAAMGVNINSLDGYPSGSTSIKYGIVLANTYDATIGPGNIIVSAGDAVATYNLVGNNNANVRIYGPNESASFANFVMRNGAPVQPDILTNKTSMWLSGGKDMFDRGLFVGSLQLTAPTGSMLACLQKNGGSADSPAPCHFGLYYFNDGSNWQGYSLYNDANGFHITPEAGGSGARKDLYIGNGQANAVVAGAGLLKLGQTTVQSLPSPSSYPGGMILVTDSTAVSSEGQPCSGGSSNKAVAISNGSSWKCF
jgi:hypothetical protein